MPTLPPTLKSRALRLLSTREHSRAELQRKLQPFEPVKGALALLLDELQAKNFISEQRVLESVLHQRAAKLGGTRIRHELQAKGLAPEAVAQALARLQETELARAHEVWRKKFGSKPFDATNRAKQIRFLVGRGFSGDVACRVVLNSKDESLEGDEPA